MTTAAPALHVLCAGAAKGLLQALQPAFEAEHGVAIDVRFDAVGSLQEALLAGAPCDLLIATEAMVAELAAAGRLLGDTRLSLGRVRTGMAVRNGTPLPDVSTADSLRAALLAADGVYFPDPARATAGIHFAAVLRQLDVDGTLKARLRTFPNGATAMRELAASAEATPIGCTQITEIAYTAGVTLAGALPARFELATVYSGAVCRAAVDPAVAGRLLALLGGGASAALRRSGGFEL